MSWILSFVELYESGVSYRMWVEPSVLLSAFVNRELNLFWTLIIKLVELNQILESSRESWIRKEVNLHITGCTKKIWGNFPLLPVQTLPQTYTRRNHTSGSLIQVMNYQTNIEQYVTSFSVFEIQISP